MYGRQLGLEMLLAMARAPRQRRPAMAAAVAVVALVLIVVPVVVVASDGVTHDDDDALMQAPWLELTLLAGWLLLPWATLCRLGLRPRQADDYQFARVPGARLWLAYLVSLFFTGLAACLMALLLGAVLSTPRDLSDVDGSREAFGWLFIRSGFFMVGGGLLCGIGLVVAVITLAAVTRVQRRRGTAGDDEVAGATFLIGILMLVLCVFALPISVLLQANPGRRLVVGLSVGALIVLTTLVLLWIARRADRKAEVTGAPDWTRGYANTRMSPEAMVTVGGILTMVIVWFVVAWSGVDFRASEVLFACHLTECTAVGLTIAGWLIVALPATFIIAMAAFWRRLGHAARIALLLITLLLCGNGTLFFPGGEETLSDHVIGGLGWAGAGVAAVLVWCLIAAMADSRYPALKRRATIVASSLALLLVALGVAIVRAEPAMMNAEALFPATLRMNGDTLTRTMSRNQRGCDGILPDDSRLNARECLLSVHASYVTDDSDTVVTIHATRYRDLAAARDVADGLGADVRPTGISGEVVTDSFQNFKWVAIVAAGHSDGRPISKEEESWVRWPLRQVTLHFLGSQLGGIGEPKAEPSASPKTP